jgi:HlyD family secretion protein
MSYSNLQPPTPEQESDLLAQKLDRQIATTITPQEDIPPQPDKITSATQRFWMGFFLALSLVGVGVLVWQWLVPSLSLSKTVAAPQKTISPRAVETISLQTGSGTKTIQLLGQVESTDRSTVKAQTGGVIELISVQPGDRVRVGQTIAILDDSEQQLDLSQAEAELAQERSNLARLEVGTRSEIIAQRQAAVTSAKAREKEAIDNLKRTSNLVKQGALSQRSLVEANAEVDEIEGNRLEAEALLAEAVSGPIREEIEAQRSRLNAAIARVDRAKLNRQRTQIIANTTGVVETRHVSQGDFLETSDQVITLIGDDRLDIFLELPEDLGSKVSVGMTIELTARALPQWKQRSTITAIVPSADQVSRRQRIRIGLNNPPSGLLSGMAISGNLFIPSNDSGFLVSRDVLTRRQDKWFVFAIENGKAKQYEVEMVSDLGETVVITSDRLRSGQNIVIRGGDSLQDGSVVKVVVDRLAS